MVDLFFYKKIEDVEQAALEEKEAGEKAFAKDEKNWDKQEEEGAGEEEQWAA